LFVATFVVFEQYGGNMVAKIFIFDGHCMACIAKQKNQKIGFWQGTRGVG